MALSAQTQMILCGGGVAPEPAIKEFVERAGGDKAKILYVSFANNYPEWNAASFKEMIESYLPHTDTVSFAPFLRPVLNADGHEILNDENEPQFFEELSEKEKTLFHRQVSEASAIWFSGGNQDRFMRVMGRHPDTKKLLQEAFLSGKLMAGTSAGAAVAAQIMVVGHRYQPHFWQEPGLGFLNAVIDQHLFVKGRVERFRSSVQDNQAEVRYGIGIDEDAAILVTDGNRLTVFKGGSDVLIIDPRDTSSGKMKEIRLRPGERFDLLD
jgi:cyanophycinase